MSSSNGTGGSVWEHPSYYHALAFDRVQLDEPFAASVEGTHGTVRGNDPPPPDWKQLLKAGWGAPAMLAADAVQDAHSVASSGGLRGLVMETMQRGALLGLGVLLIAVGAAALLWSNRETVLQAADVAVPG